MNLRKDPIIVRLREVLLTNNFWIQAEEQDGDDEYRMTVSFGRDDGRWFVLTARIDDSNPSTKS